MRLLLPLPLPLLLWPWLRLPLGLVVAEEEQSHGWHVHRLANDGSAARSRDSTPVSGTRVATAAPRRANDDKDGVVLLLLILLIVVVLVSAMDRTSKRARILFCRVCRVWRRDRSYRELEVVHANGTAIDPKIG